MKRSDYRVASLPDLNSTPTRRALVFPLFLIGGATILALALVVYLNLPSLKRLIIAEVKSGNLTKAYDLYLTSKSSLAKSDLDEITVVLLPAAETKCDRMIDRLKQEAVDSDWSEAARLYSWMNELKPNPRWNAKSLFSQARLAFSRKDFDKAIEYYRKSIEIDPSSALTYNALGRAYWGRKDGATAKDCYQRAIALEPAWVYPYMNLGGLFLELNDYSSAEQTLQNAISIDPRKAATHNLVGQVYEKMGRWCDAVSHYSTALQTIGPSDTPNINQDNIRNKISRLQSRYRCTSR